MKYIYFDGSGNKYQIKDSELSYSPITKEMSSSGNYDGGQAYAKTLSKLELIKLVDVFERAFWDENSQSDKREMGTGLLLKEMKGQATVKVILKRRSEINNEILELLR